MIKAHAEARAKRRCQRLCGVEVDRGGSHDGALDLKALRDASGDECTHLPERTGAPLSEIVACGLEATAGAWRVHLLVAERHTERGRKS